METRRPLGRAAIALALATALGCGGAPPAKRAIARPAKVVKTPPAPAGPKGPPMLPATIVAELDDEDTTPYFARAANGGSLLMWASKGRWRTRALGPGGAPRGDTADAGPAPSRVPFASLRASGDGFVAAWAEPVERNHLVKVLALDGAGQPRGAAVLVTQSSDELSFLDVLPAGSGALLLWEIARGDRADVLVAPVPSAKAKAVPSLVAQGVLGWEAASTDKGVVLATVAAAPGKDSAGAQLGRVLFTEIDAHGKPGAPVVVSAEPTAQIDVGIVAVGGRYVVSWTDERDIDPSVHLAAVEPGGKIAAAPRRAMPPVGEQALVALVAPAPSSAGGRALLAWEDLVKTPREGRLIHLATVGADASLGADRATLLFASNGPPDLVADGDGFAAMTLAPASAKDAGAAPGPDAPLWPAYVRFGADLAVRASEPVRALPFAASGGDGVPYLTRTLSCDAGACVTLASGSGVPAPLAVVSLPVRSSSWRAPAWRAADDTPPRLESLAAIFDGDHLAEVAAVELEPRKSSLVAWVTYYLDGASGDGTPRRGKPGEEPLAATLAVRPIGPDGPGKITVVSQRALSIGGVALAAAPADPGGKPRETVMAWVARDKGDAQVFVTKLGPDGAKLAQKKLTIVPRRPGKGGGGTVNEASDVAIAADGEGGFLVAWVDTRDDNPEIYVARIDRDLKKTVPDQRITDAPGDSAEVQIAVRGKETLLVWSDARQAPDAGNADIYLARIDTRTLRKLGPETRLFASAGHSRTPLLTGGSPLVAAWIEEPVDDPAAGAGKRAGAGSIDSGVRIAPIDDKGALVGSTVLVQGEQGGSVTSLALACAEQRCRGVVTSAVDEALVLGAFQVAPGAPPGPLKTIASLSGGVTEDVSPVLTSPAADALVFADDAVGGSGRVRWMKIGW